MSEEDRNHETVINEHRPELTGYLSETGKICLRQDLGVGESEVDVIRIDPEDIDNLVDHLNHFQQLARQLPVQEE